MSNKDLDQEVELLKAPEVAKLLGVSVRTVMTYKAKNVLPYYQVGRVLRFPKAEILKHIEEHTVNPLVNWKGGQNNGK